MNSISGLFPKENHEWIKWIQDGKAICIDQKEKVLSLINSLRTNPEETERIGLNLDSVAKLVEDFENSKENGDKVDDASTKTFDEFLESPDLKFSIKNEEQRKAAQNKPDKWKQYAIVDIDKPSKISFADNHPARLDRKGRKRILRLLAQVI